MLKPPVVTRGTSWSEGSVTTVRRRSSRGSRPSALAVPSISAFAASPVSGSGVVRSQPSALAAARRSASWSSAGAAIQSGISCAGAGPRSAPVTRWCRPSTCRGERTFAAQMPRMTSMASSSPPDTPRPSSTRPPESRSRLAAARASTAALPTGPAAPGAPASRRTRSVRAATQLRNVHGSTPAGSSRTATRS
ncbi:unnamed protein product [[Actinomadura] parvosata subsp. kistnae]|nr:unnamed protein product [Actinomadura parvosata subsp. kistnae]